MNEEHMPGVSPADREVNRRWREGSVEEPSSLADARIRAAARQAIASDGSRDSAGRSSRWNRFVPLAAAASVALLAVGLVRLIPQDAYRAPGITHHEATREAAPPTGTEPAQSAEPEVEPPNTHLFAADPPTTRAEQAERAAAPTLRQEQTRPAESAPAPSPSQRLRRADEVAPGSGAAGIAGVASEEIVRPVESLATAPRAKASAPATSDSAATSVVTTAARPSSAEAPVSVIPEALATEIRRDAARRTGADPASIRIVSVEPSLWPDASLGCAPQSEHAETPVPGYMVTVKVPGTSLRYHTDDRDRVAVCQAE